MSIYQKLLEIQKGLSSITKNTQGYGYMYTSPTEILSLVRPLMDQHGVILKQELDSADTQIVNTTTKSGEEKQELVVYARMLFTWIDVDTGEKDVNMFGAIGCNGWDKGIGSAYTYAERYFLLKFFHIPTDQDDPDSQQPREIKKQSVKRKDTAQKPKSRDDLPDCPCGKGKLYPNGGEKRRCYKCNTTFIPDENGELVPIINGSKNDGALFGD